MGRCVDEWMDDEQMDTLYIYIQVAQKHLDIRSVQPIIPWSDIHFVSNFCLVSSRPLKGTTN